jgi:hypothetical protein
VSFFGRRGYGWINGGGGCKSWRRIAGKWRRGRALTPYRLARCGRADPRRAARHQHKGGLSRREERRGPATVGHDDRRRRKTRYIGSCDNVRTPAGFLEPAMVTMPYSAATHYRHAHLISKSASPGERGGSHSKQGCSTGARSMGGGYGLWLTFHTRTRISYMINPGKWPGKLFSAAAGALASIFW